MNANKFWMTVFLASLFLPATAEETTRDLTDAYCVARTQYRCDIYGVSMLNLIITPERFHGEKVRVVGYMIVNGGAILHYAPPPLYLESLRLSFTEIESFETEEDVDKWQSDLNKVRRFSGKWVLIEGVFDMKIPMDPFYNIPFWIRKITRLENYEP